MENGRFKKPYFATTYAKASMVKKAPKGKQEPRYKNGYTNIEQ